jgi:hypothetical protein
MISLCLWSGTQVNDLEKCGLFATTPVAKLKYSSGVFRLRELVGCPARKGSTSGCKPPQVVSNSYAKSSRRISDLGLVSLPFKSIKVCGISNTRIVLVVV